jgi:acyl dehydratase
MKTFQTLKELAACVGQTVAVSPWTEITQAQVNMFAEATGDHQWIHIDVEKAKAGPFGAPIAHGFLTLSLIPKLSQSAIKIKDVRMGVNYGLNKVRFTSPVPVGSKVRGHMKLLDAVAIDGNGMQFTWEMKIEREGSEKPSCIAESLARYYV